MSCSYHTISFCFVVVRISRLQHVRRWCDENLTNFLRIHPGAHKEAAGIVDGALRLDLHLAADWRSECIDDISSRERRVLKRCSPFDSEHLRQIFLHRRVIDIARTDIDILYGKFKRELAVLRRCDRLDLQISVCWSRYEIRCVESIGKPCIRGGLDFRRRRPLHAGRPLPVAAVRSDILDVLRNLGISRPFESGSDSFGSIVLAQLGNGILPREAI